MHYIILIMLMFITPAYAQEVKEVKDAVPAEIFNYIMAGVTAIVIALSSAIVILWRSKGTGLSPEQQQTLTQIHEVLLPLNQQLQEEQAGRRADIERLMGEQKEVFVKGLELTGKLPPLMADTRDVLIRVESLLRRQEP